MKIFMLLILAIYIFGCKSEHKSQIYAIANNKSDTIHLALQNGVNGFPIDSFELVKIVPLETNKKFLIGYINRIDVLDSCFYIFDQQSEAIYSYDFDGNANSKFYRKGRSGEEYIELKNYFIDEKVKKIFIPDQYRKSILQYNLDSKFERRIKLDNYVSPYISVTSDNNFFVLNNEDSPKLIDSRVWIFNPAGILSEKHLENRPIMEKLIPHHLLNPISKYKDSIYFLGIYDHYIYCYDDKHVTPVYYLDFGKNKYSEKILNEKQKTDIDIDPFIRYELPRSIENIFITDRHIHLIAIFLNKAYDVFYNKTTKNTVLTWGYSFGETENILPERLVGATNDWFVFIVSPINFKNQVKLLNASFAETGKTRHQIAKLNSIDSKISDMDNPILLLYKLKH